LDNIEIKGAVVTIDAAGCQREIAKKIIDGKGNYVFGSSAESVGTNPLKTEFASANDGIF